VNAPAGTFVFARPGVMRTAFAGEPGTIILAIGGRPGEAYEPDGWELWMPVAPLFIAAKDPDLDAISGEPAFSEIIDQAPRCLMTSSTSTRTARAGAAGQSTSRWHRVRPSQRMST